MDKFSTQDLELDQSKRAMACYFSVGSDKFCNTSTWNTLYLGNFPVCSYTCYRTHRNFSDLAWQE